MPLTLDRQNTYRARYARLKPGWQPATVVYETTIRNILADYAKPIMLDFGCGRGGVLEQLVDVAAMQPVGIDPDWHSLVEHRQPALKRATAYADDLPFCDASFDVVISAWVLEHLPDPARTFAEVARVLRPGGRFIFMAPNRNSPIALLNRLLQPLQEKLVPRLYGREEADTFPVVYAANTYHQITTLCIKSGMTLRTFNAIDDPTYIAFNDPLFWLSRQASRLLPESAAVHLVGVAHKEVA